MAKMIQVRNVPARLHRELTRRARARGQTLTAFIEELLEREVATPSREELFALIQAREPVDLGLPVADLIREERELREQWLASSSTRRP